MNRFTSLGCATSIDVDGLSWQERTLARRLTVFFRNLFVLFTVGALVLPATVARAGNLYATYFFTAVNFNLIREFGPTGADLGDFASIPNYGHGLAFDTSGNLYVAYDDKIHRFGPTGTDLGTFASTPFDVPLDIAFDASGNLYASTLYKRIDKFSPTGANLGAFVTMPIDTAPQGIAFDSSGNLFTANAGPDNIHKYGPTGTDLGVFGIGGLGTPIDIAFDASGNVYVSYYDQNTIHKFSPTGAHLGTFATEGLNGPAGIAFDAGGNLYVANGFDRTIRKFDPTGTDLGTFASTPSGTNVGFIAFSPIPEPGTLTLLASAAAVLCGVLCFRRRR